MMKTTTLIRHVATGLRRRSRKESAILTAAGLGVLALLLTAVTIVPGARATTTDLTTTDTTTTDTLNHVYIAFHGAPSCDITLLANHRDGSIERFGSTQVGSCQYALEWKWSQVSDTQVNIDSGTDTFTEDFTSQFGPHHDHCILVKAFGHIVYTGDETQKCRRG